MVIFRVSVSHTRYTAFPFWPRRLPHVVVASVRFPYGKAVGSRQHAATVSRSLAGVGGFLRCFWLHSWNDDGSIHECHPKLDTASASARLTLPTRLRLRLPIWRVVAAIDDAVISFSFFGAVQKNK